MGYLTRCMLVGALAIQLGCAATAYVPPETGNIVQMEFSAEFIQTDRADAAQILAFKDPVSCDKHPRGIFIGRLCPDRGPGFACRGMSLSQNFEAGTPITLKFEYKFGDITTEHGACNNQFTLTPRSGNRYRAYFRVEKERCSTVVQTSKEGASWAADDTVTYENRFCLWM